MPIRVSCTNCGKQFSAWEDLIGKAVKCPKCQHEMIVQKGAAGKTPSKAANKTSSKTPQKAAGTPRARRPAAPPKPAPAAPYTGTAPTPITQAESAQAAKPRTEHRISSRPSRDESPDHESDFDDSDALPIACPNCNAPMPPQEDLCDHCGYHKILGKVIDLDGVQRRNNATGFERAVQKHLHGEDTAGMLFWTKITAGFFLLLVLRFCLGGWFWIAGLLLIGGYLLYQKQRTASGDEASVNADPVSQALWLLALHVQRAIGWRKAEWPFSQVRALVLRDPKFDDEDVEDLENMDDIQAVDFEGTGISNAGLSYLADCRTLRFIVLRRTKVTSEGVRRLQQALPEAWIWD